MSALDDAAPGKAKRVLAEPYVLGIFGWIGFFVAAEVFATFLQPGGDFINIGIYFVMSLPFGFSFPFLLRSLIGLSRQNSRWGNFSAGTLVVDSVLLVCLFLLSVEWVNYWSRIWTI